VAHDKLRFDFSHQKGLRTEEINNIEALVNQMIIDNNEVNTALSTPAEAIERGAMALFGEKYGDEVRVVNMGNSIELCGGTHVNQTGDIGLFKITAEEAIASGIRRIEALTGLAAVEYVTSKADLLKDATLKLKCSESELINRLTSLQDDKKKLERELSSFRLKSAISGDITPIDIGDIKFLSKNLDGVPPQDLKTANDLLRAKVSSGVIAISSVCDGKVSLVVSVSSDLTSRIKAGDLVKEAAKLIGGNGGGKPDYAQAGGTEIAGIEAAMSAVKSMIQ